MSLLQNALQRLDSWVNALSGVGTGLGRNAFSFQPDAPLDLETLDALYSGDAFAARICDAVPRHALRRGFAVETGDADRDTELTRAHDRLRSRERFAEAWTWARVFGGALVFVGADDGLDPDMPLDLARVDGVKFLTVIDRRDAIPNSWNSDTLSARFGEPETYRFTRSSNGGTVDVGVVHASRVIRFDGALTTRRRRHRNQGWADSELQRVLDKLSQFNGAFAATGTLLQDASQAVMKVKGLYGMLAQDNTDRWKNRMRLMDLTRSAANAVLVDSDGEDFTRVEVGAMSGLPPTLQMFLLLLAGAAEIPLTILFGQSPAGMNATGESDTRMWYDRIAADRENVLRPRLERLTRMMLGPAKVPSLRVTFPSLWQPTPAEEADLRQKQSAVDVAYIGAQVLTPEEVACSRFRPEGWSAETAIELEAREGALAGGGGGVPAGGAAGKDDAAGLDHEAVMGVVERVGARAIDRGAGVGILMTMGLTQEQAEASMGETGRTVFTAPEPGHQAAMDELTAKYAAMERSQRSTKQLLVRVLEKNRAGELVVNPIGSKTLEGEQVEPGDVVAIEAPDAPAEEAP